jgi:hypothetical protein
VTSTESDRPTSQAISPPIASRAALRWQLTMRSRMALAAVLVGIPALLLYLRTLLPDVGFWDTAEFQAIGPVLGIAHPTGYPAYTLLAWLASVVLQPFGNEALRANLLSAILVALACATVGATVALLTRRLVVGVGAGITLAVATEAWSVGLHADPHAFHVLLVAVLLLLLVVWGDRTRAGRNADRWLIGAAALFGLALANHALTLLLAPGIGLYVLAVQPRILLKPRLLISCVAALVLTTVVLYAYLPIRSAMNPPLDYANPQTWQGFSYLVFAEQFRGTFRALPDVLDALRQIANENFAQLGLLAVLALLGLIVGALRRPALVLMLVVWFAVNWWFALGYENADIGRYYLVPLLAVTVLGGLGAGAILEGAAHLIHGLAPERRALARWAVAIVAALVLIVPPVASVSVHISSVDESADRGGRRFLDDVAAALPQNAVIVSWWSYSTPMWYGQYVEHWRPDVTIIDDRTILDQGLGNVDQVLNSYLGQRPLFLIRLPSDLRHFQDEFVLTRVEQIPDVPVYRVDGRQPVSSRANL